LTHPKRSVWESAHFGDNFCNDILKHLLCTQHVIDVMDMPITHVTLMACQAAGVYGEVGTGVRKSGRGVTKYEGGVSEDMGGLHVSVSL
jgi:hypothetical protein